MLKKILKSLSVFGLCLGMLSIPAVKADATPQSITGIGLNYLFVGNWANGFSATMRENDGSPTTWKQVLGNFNTIDSSGRESGYTSFDSGSKQGQLTYNRTIGTSYNNKIMNRVNCTYYAGGTYYAARYL